MYEYATTMRLHIKLVVFTFYGFFMVAGMIYDNFMDVFIKFSTPTQK